MWKEGAVVTTVEKARVDKRERKYSTDKEFFETGFGQSVSEDATEIVHLRPCTVGPIPSKQKFDSGNHFGSNVCLV